MLITDLDLTQKRALAKDIRRCVEPNKAKTTRILKENELRRFLIKEKSITYMGFSEIISILRTNYAEATIKRLVSKIQPSIVWDTSLCRLAFEDIENLFDDKNNSIIITTAVLDEIIKLAKNPSAKECLIAKMLLTKIFEDTSSEFCSIVDIPRMDYVDDQLLYFCQTNNYKLYTYDYTLGLRANIRKINVHIFMNSDSLFQTSYIPNPSGKNILLSEDLISNVSFKDIFAIAESLNFNKFVITNDFIEKLENTKAKYYYRDIIRFLASDTSRKYSIYVPIEEKCDFEHLCKLTQKYNCFIMSSDISVCTAYKMNYIPYKLVGLNTLDKSTVNSENVEEINSCESDLAIKTEKTDMISSADNTAVESTLEKEEKGSDEILDSLLDLKISNSLIPYYSPCLHKISLKKMLLNERIWVLDTTGKEIAPISNSYYEVFSGYTVIYTINSSTNSFKMNVYKVVNEHYNNYCVILFSEKFKDNNISKVSEEWRSYAQKAIMITTCL